MDQYDKGKVKFQNAFEYYDIMYNLTKYMIKASYAYNTSNINTANTYFKSICELFYFIEPFVQEENMILFYKNAIKKAIINLELDSNTARNIFELPKKNVEELMLFNKENINNISQMIDKCKEDLINAGIYKKNVTELSKRLIKLKDDLDNIKRLLNQSMKDNKLTVPVNNYDASRAILGGK